MVLVTLRGWCRMQTMIKIKDAFVFLKKSKIKAGDGLEVGKYPFYTSSSVLSKYLDSYEIEEESLIFGTGGSASVHHSYGKFSSSTDCFVAQSNNKYELDLRYVYLFLSGNIHILENGFKGAGLKHISKKYLEDVEIPVPPLETQKKIVEILDKAQGLIDARKEQIRLMNELLQSVFYEMFGDLDKNNKGFPIVKVGEVCLKVTDGKHGGCEKEDGSGFYYVGAREIFDYEIHYDTAPQITFKDFEKDYRRCNLENGDLVIVNTGATIGKTAIANNVLTEKTLLQKSVALLKADKEKITAKFLQYIYICNERLYKVKSASAQPNLLLSQIRETEIYLPSIELQYEFIQFTKQVDKLKVQAQKSLDEIQVLFDSLAQKYFQ